MISDRISNYQKFILIFQITCDYLFIFLALKFADYFYQISPFRFNEAFPPYSNLLLMLFSGVVVLFLLVTSSYQRQLTVYNIEEEVKIVKAVLFSIVFIILVGFIINTLFLNRLFIFYSCLFLIFYILFSRRIFSKIINYLRSKNKFVINTAIYGAGEVGMKLYEQFQRIPQSAYNVVGFIDDFKDNHVSNPVRIIGNFDSLSELINHYNINEIIIAMPSITSEKIYKIIKVCNELGIKYRFVPNLFRIIIQKVKMDHLGGIPLISYKEPKYEFFNMFFKRIFDYIFSIFIILFSSPFWIIVSLLIKMDSKGPVLFKQKRVGKNGIYFTMYKFRSMFIDTPKYEYCPQKNNDPRITRIGRFLRKTSLDELPQFINVIKGDMSVVGPRPEMPFIVEQYKDIHKERLKVKPGITGFWQISPYRSELIHENIDYDLYYIYNQSFILDLLIIFKTIFFAMRGI